MRTLQDNKSQLRSTFSCRHRLRLSAKSQLFDNLIIQHITHTWCMPVCLPPRLCESVWVDKDEDMQYVCPDADANLQLSSNFGATYNYLMLTTENVSSTPGLGLSSIFFEKD